jgi:REP element-mobilizing transposase RayT
MEHRTHLRRLDRRWVDRPVYFIAVCTAKRRAVLASADAAAVLFHEWQSARERHGWLVGRYVIMPDHVHFFCAETAAGAQRPLARFMGKWNEWTAKGICQALGLSAPFWQEQFFDHVLRSDESYAEKWAYVRDNPVRAGLTATWEKWSWQGWVDFDYPKSM